MLMLYMLFVVFLNLRTKGKSQSCVQYKGEAYVQNLWEGLEKYVFNGTRKLNGTELYIWAVSDIIVNYTDQYSQY